MTKRNQWVLTCVVFATMWGVMGLLVWPFFFFAFVSVLMIIIPVGVDEADPGKDRHDAHKWSKHE